MSSLFPLIHQYKQNNKVLGTWCLTCLITSYIITKTLTLYNLQAHFDETAQTTFENNMAKGENYHN